MGLIRGGAVFFLGILLFFSFLAMNSFFILQSSLKYDNVKEGIYSVVQNINNTIPKELIGDFNLTKASENEFKKAMFACQRNSSITYFFQYEGYSANVSCDTVLQGSQAFIDKALDDTIENIYYKEYDCNFWNCFSKTELPFFLVSQKAHDYWKSKFYLFLVVSLILVILIFLFAEQRMNTPIIVGILLVLSALPLLKLGDVVYAIAGKFSSLVNLFLSSTKTVFFFSLILGILLVGSGIALRIWNPGGIKEKLSKNEVKEIVKEEIKKTNSSRLGQVKGKQAKQVKKKK